MNVIPYTWIDEEKMNVPSRSFRLSMTFRDVNGRTVGLMLSLGRGVLTRESAPIKPSEFSGIMELFEFLLDMNVDIRVG